MKFIVDARLENGEPRLRLVDADTGAIKFVWSLVAINGMFDQGDIDPDDFLHPQRYGMNLLIKNLFLISCLDERSHGHHTNHTPAADAECRRSKSPGWDFKLRLIGT